MEIKRERYLNTLISKEDKRYHIQPADFSGEPKSEAVLTKQIWKEK